MPRFGMTIPGKIFKLHYYLMAGVAQFEFLISGWVILSLRRIWRAEDVHPRGECGRCARDPSGPKSFRMTLAMDRARARVWKGASLGRARVHSCRSVAGK